MSMPPKPKPLFVCTSVLAAALQAAATVSIVETPNRIELSNGATKLIAHVEGGKAGGFDLIDARAGKVVAHIDVAAGGCRVEHTLSKDRQAGAILFQTTRPAVGLRVALVGDEPFPLVSFEVAGAESQVRFLACRMASAQVLYRGGVQSLLPNVDPFPASIGDLKPVPLAACPVPAAGLWDPAAGVFAAFEFQQARMTDRSAARVEAGVDDARALVLLAPARAKIGCMLIYSTGLPEAASPNAFVLDHIRATYAGLWPARRGSLDVGWLPAREEFVPDDRTRAELLHRVSKASLAPEAICFTDATTLPTGSCRGALNLLRSSDEPRKRILWRQWGALEAKAIREGEPGQERIHWRFPVEGEYDGLLGGQPAATDRSPATWLVGAAALAMYQHTRDPELLRYVDGVLGWTRHCAATRGGDPAKPAASAVTAARAATEFLLPLHHIFANDPDEARRAMAAEALTLWRSIIYRCLAIYTSDPDTSDNVDPTFLVQGDSARESFGSASWDGTEELLAAMALCCVETGDELLGRLLAGALERWHLGIERDGLRTVESLRVAGADAGRRLGIHVPSDALARYVQPIGDARVRVLCGQKDALVFCRGVRARVEGYAFEPGRGFGFRLAVDRAEPVEINITSPFRNLRGKTVRLNGRTADAEVAGLHGENVIVRGVRNGDVVSIGGVAASRVVRAPVWDGALAASPRTVGAAMLPMAAVEGAAVALDQSWERGGSWAGLREGVQWAWGAPFRIADAAKRARRIAVGRHAGAIYLLLSASSEAVTARLTYADGQVEDQTLAEGLPALWAGPIRAWRIDAYAIMPKRETIVSSIDLSGNALLFAVTVREQPAAAFDAAIQRVRAAKQARLAARRAKRERELAKQRMVPESRARVAAAAKGKMLRIAFIPPQEAYTDVLRAACVKLGAPPTMLSPQGFVDPAEFNAKRYPVAVYSAHETFAHTILKPGDGLASMKRYLAEGGTFVVAGGGVPFYYPLRWTGDAFERMKGKRHGVAAPELGLLINHKRMPTRSYRYVLEPGQTLLPHVLAPFRYKPISGPYRPVAGSAAAKTCPCTPAMWLANMDDDGKTRDMVAAVIEHTCKRYTTGRMIALWGNILETEHAPAIALDVMTNAITHAKLPSATGDLRPCAALLPGPYRAHDAVVLKACEKAKLKVRALTVEEFIDPAVFNPRHFPIAIHALGDESFIDACFGRKDLWQVYVDYVRMGGVLVACGNMWQFFYAATLGADGKWSKQYDPEQKIPSGLGLRLGFGFADNPGLMFLKRMPGQDILHFNSPMPLDYIHWGRYRAVMPSGMKGVEFTPLAKVVGEGKGPDRFKGYMAAVVRYHRDDFNNGEVVWLWGELMDRPQGHTLIEQLIAYAANRRVRELGGRVGRRQWPCVWWAHRPNGRTFAVDGLQGDGIIAESMRLPHATRAKPAATLGADEIDSERWLSG